MYAQGEGVEGQMREEWVLWLPSMRIEIITDGLHDFGLSSMT